VSVSYSPAFSANAAADHPQDKASASRVENFNPWVELGPGLKILLCNRFNTGLKLFMSKNEGFFYFWESMPRTYSISTPGLNIELCA
jgi:hypothetical protein